MNRAQHSRSGEGVDAQVSLFGGILRGRAGAPEREAKRDGPRKQPTRRQGWEIERGRGDDQSGIQGGVVRSGRQSVNYIYLPFQL